MPEIKNFIIDEFSVGKRTDVFLSSNLTDFSRAAIQKMEKNFDNSHKLKLGENVIVHIPEPAAQPVIKKSKSKTKLDILFEDDDVIAINKPRGMVMYPAAGNATGTLVQEILNYTNLSTLGGGVRPGVVHRIDKDTSGVVILAKTDAAFRKLIEVFSEHKLKRKYIAFVWGIPTWTSADIEGNIARSSRNRQKMNMVKTGGKPAKTIADVMNVWTKSGVSEIRCTLLTGRTHQIRVHLSAHGFPVLTDPTYGKGRETKLKQSELLSFLRNHDGQCLHAEILELDHPITGEHLKIKAPLSEDLVELKELLSEY